MLTSINPKNEEILSEYEEHHQEDVKEILNQSQEAFLQWQETEFSHRTRLMKKAANILRERADNYAKLMADEMGKPLVGGRAEVEKCAWACEYYADNAEQFLKNEFIETDASKSFVTFQPLGVVLAIMPWNFPLWQAFRFAVPALMAGNAGGTTLTYTKIQKVHQPPVFK